MNWFVHIQATFKYTFYIFNLKFKAKFSVTYILIKKWSLSHYIMNTDKMSSKWETMVEFSATYRTTSFRFFTAFDIHVSLEVMFVLVAPWTVGTLKWRSICNYVPVWNLLSGWIKEKRLLATHSFIHIQFYSVQAQ